MRGGYPIGLWPRHGKGGNEIADMAGRPSPVHTLGQPLRRYCGRQSHSGVPRRCIHDHAVHVGGRRRHCDSARYGKVIVARARLGCVHKLWVLQLLSYQLRKQSTTVPNCCLTDDIAGCVGDTASSLCCASILVPTRADLRRCGRKACVLR